jgi:hypothetical protein
MNPVGVLFVLAGLFAISVATNNWNWFFSRQKSQALVILFGRDGARVFYGVAGAAVVVLGMFHALGSP